MKLILKALSVFVLGLWMAQSANATVLTFDDLTPTTDSGTINDGYGGFNWDQFGYYNIGCVLCPGSGYENGVVSGEYAAFNEYANVATVNNGLFDFTSTYLTSAWTSTLEITVEGWSGGSMLYSTTVTAVQDVATLFTFDFIGIDSLVFNSYSVSQFAMDDFTFNESSVPEPGVLALLSLGLFGIGATRRFRR